MTAFKNLHMEVSDRIATLTIDRPDVLNALDRATLGEMAQAFTSLDPSVRVAILSGAGERAFVAGADITELAGMGGAEALEFSRQGQALMRTIEQLHIPVVAAVSGFALGGGLELALACDFILAGGRASFAMPELALGVIPGFGGIARLGARVGIARARELLYTGRRLGAKEALAMGLVSCVYESGELESEVRKVAQEIARKAPLALASVKASLNADGGGTMTRAISDEATRFSSLFDTKDQKEGMRAFLEKREPQWTSR